MTDERVAEQRRLIAALLGPGEPELTCDECFDRLDRYVELELAGAASDERIPGMRPHLTGCPACRDDHESLMAFVAGEPPLNPASH